MVFKQIVKEIRRNKMFRLARFFLEQKCIIFGGYPRDLIRFQIGIQLENNFASHLIKAFKFLQQVS